MRTRIGYAATAAILVGYLALAGSRALLLVRHGTPLTVLLGATALVFPVLGGWFLWRTTRFAWRAERLAAELDAAGGWPPDEVVRLASGRAERASADAVFQRRRAETERAPNDWRCWFRLALAYRDARDTPRARQAIQRAIALHDASAARTRRARDGGPLDDDGPGDAGG